MSFPPANTTDLPRDLVLRTLHPREPHCHLNEIMSTKTEINSNAKAVDVQRLVSIIRRGNYRVIEHIGGWHQNIVADVIHSDGSSEAREQATIYTFDYPTKQDCINDAQRIADFLNANSPDTPNHPGLNEIMKTKTPETESAPCPPIDWDAVRWRRLEEGEEVKEGDYSDACADGWNDEPRWEKLVGVIPGNFAPANYPAHRRYRRIIPPTTPA